MHLTVDRSNIFAAAFLHNLRCSTAMRTGVSVHQRASLICPPPTDTLLLRPAAEIYHPSVSAGLQLNLFYKNAKVTSLHTRPKVFYRRPED